MQIRKRPSNAKVTGVSNRYVSNLERRYAANLDRHRLDNEQLLNDEKNMLARYIATEALLSVIQRPLQARRHKFLLDAMERDGKSSPSRTVASFALAKCSNPIDYPLVIRQVRSTTQE
jgi:hypothetical protein